MKTSTLLIVLASLATPLTALHADTGNSQSNSSSSTKASGSAIDKSNAETNVSSNNSSKSDNSTAITKSTDSSGANTSSLKSGSSDGSDNSSKNEGESSKSSQVEAPTVSQFQSPARPDGLKPVGPVYVGGTDAASKTFQTKVLPSLVGDNIINLNKVKVLPNVDSVSIDPSKIQLATSSAARAYFVGESAGYENSTGFNVNNYGTAGNSAQLIFPNASTNNAGSLYSGPQNLSNPLEPGDFVNLGNFKAGSLLDFFIVSNGANGGNNVFSTSTPTNPDSFDHVRAYALLDSPYLVIAYEDLYGGGDKDYNDTIEAIDIGTANVAYLAGPEPSAFILTAMFLTGVLVLRRRQMKKAPTK
jgi:hypothetical protein